jgi:hypothetical protein
MKLELLRAKIEESKRRVSQAERELESDLQKLTDARGGEKTVVSTLLEHAFTTLRNARQHLGDLTELLASAEDGPHPAERNCPACDKLIRADARLCGYCWQRLV